MAVIPEKLVSIEQGEASRSDGDRIVLLLTEIRNGIQFLVANSGHFPLVAQDGPGPFQNWNEQLKRRDGLVRAVMIGEMKT